MRGGDVKTGMRVQVASGSFARTRGTVERVTIFRRSALVALDGISPPIWMRTATLEPLPDEEPPARS